MKCKKIDFTIGDSTTIAAKAKVVKDVEPYSIAGGNPVKEIRKRFSASEIEKLLELKWWDWRIEKIIANVQNLTGNKLHCI